MVQLSNLDSTTSIEVKPKKIKAMKKKETDNVKEKKKTKVKVCLY